MIIKSKLAFGIASRAWAAINDSNEIIEIIPMNGYTYFSAG